MGKVQRKSAISFQGPLLGESHGTHTATSCDNKCRICCHSGKLVRDSIPGVFPGLGHIDSFCLAHHPNSTLPDGKQVFNINCMVCANSLNIISHSYFMVVGIATDLNIPLPNLYAEIECPVCWYLEEGILGGA